MMQATHDLIAVKPLTFEGHTTEAGIIVTEQVTEYRLGEIVSVGPEVDPEVQPGLILMFEKLAGYKVFHEGTDYLFIREGHAMGLVDDDYTI